MFFTVHSLCRFRKHSLQAPVSHLPQNIHNKRCVLFLYAVHMVVFLESTSTIIRDNNAGPFVDNRDEEQGRAKY